ncbi:MAG: ATP-dependent endonuclease [Bacteroidetes bacterium]|nr:ATP-dependent endonuclease [Bacteroidota bacterium]
MLAFTSDQKKTLSQFKRFDESEQKFPLMLIKGYAGTGKTTMVAWLVDLFKNEKRKFKLLAPTGRAAKVLANYTAESAFTIHKQIYFHNQDASGVKVTLAKNLHIGTTFFVDESSMISTQTDEDGRCLLRDLLNYVYTGKNCRMVLIGDDGQLPPVGQQESYALSEDYLNSSYPQLTIFSSQLERVVRQDIASSIIKNATLIRNSRNANNQLFSILDHQTRVVSSMEFQDELDGAISKYGIDEVKVLSISNKRVLSLNEGIRSLLLYREELLEKGDRVMVNKNNYYWLKNDKDIGFIANGEILEIQKVNRIESHFGFLFAQVRVSFLEFPEKENLDVILILDLLSSSQLQLDRVQSKQLFTALEIEYSHIKSKSKRLKKVFENPFWNALQVKYAYAITTHKAQGGQWKIIFIDFAGRSPEMNDGAYLKWLYTSVTRATESLFLVNCPENYLKS